MQKKRDFSLHFDGAFVKDGRLTARTLAHALAPLQRIIDKTVMFANRGTLKKGDVLSTRDYVEADVVVEPFEKGCIVVPLSGLQHKRVIGLLKGVLHDPYELAKSNLVISQARLIHEVPAAKNRVAHEIDITTHEELIKNKAEQGRKYFAESVYKDFDIIVSPLRSKSIRQEDSISIDLNDDSSSKQFEFNKEVSARFHKIVSAKQLGPIALFSGRLTEFGETKSRHFPYSGKFLSSDSRHEHKLLVTSYAEADDLRPYNTNKNLSLAFFGAPVSSWGTYDDLKGDIVFIAIKK